MGDIVRKIDLDQAMSAAAGLNESVGVCVGVRLFRAARPINSDPERGA
jgi:hypothetical protein